MALHLCHLLAELDSLLTELLLLLMHLHELPHKGIHSTWLPFNWLISRAFLLMATTASALDDSTDNLNVDLSTLA